MSRRSGQGGFTLVEVMIAVAILALGMVALSQTLGSSADAYLRIAATQRAYLIAEDKLVELQVYQKWPAVGTNDDTVTRGDRQFWVRTKISAGPYPGTRRADIDVGRIRDDNKGPLEYSLAGLLGKPARSGSGSGNGSGGQSGSGSSSYSKNLTGG